MSVRLELRSVRPGMILAAPVHTRDGNMLIEKGTVLTAHTLDLIDLWGVYDVEVEDPAESPLPRPTSTAAPSSRDVAEQRERTRRRIGDLGTWVRSEVKQVLTRIHDLRGDIDAERVRQVTTTIVDESIQSRDFMASLTSILDYDTYLFSHSVHVSILSVVVGIAMGMTRKEAHSLAAGSLLLDVGMLEIDRAIWEKPGPLSDNEFETIKRHPELGAARAEALLGDDPDALSIVRQHHERMDGSGYPRRLPARAIAPCARIAAVCDVYNAMQAPRVYRKKWLPYQVMSHLLVSSTETLDADVVKVFLRTLSAYPIGSLVKLDTGEIGVVVSSNRHSPIRPVVKIFLDARGARRAAPSFADLAADPRFIVGPVDPQVLGVQPYDEL